MADPPLAGRARGARRDLGRALLVLAWVGALVLTAPGAFAHPLGNFTVNTHLGVRVEPAAVALDVVVDVAEIPTMQAFPGLDEDSGGEVSEPAQRAYRERMCPALRDNAQLEVDGRAVELEVVSSSLSFPPGEAGLATARLECGLRTTAELDTVGHELVLTDSLAVQPVGWREITAVGDGVELSSSNVPERSISEALRNYPQDLQDTPLDQRQATMRIAEGTGVVTGAVSDTGGAATSLRGLDPLTTAFTDLVAATRLSVGFGILAVALAVLLGGLHAFAPGHGKTLMAAYLVGRNGSVRQAALIGVSVTLTHTVGVLVLGVLLSVAVLTAPEQVYPWLRLISGLLLVAIGLGLLRSAWLSRRLAGPAYGHGHGHGHRTRDVSEWAPVHDKVATLARRQEAPPGHEHPVATDGRSLLAVGFAGGLVPSPSALVVLLGGIALGRAWFGVLLVLAYGIGMALTLVGIGLVLVRARGWIERWYAARTVAGGRGGGLLALTRRLPVITAGLVVVIGLVLAAQAVILL